MAAVEPRFCGRQQHSLPLAPGLRTGGHAPGKKTTEAIQQEVSREVERLLALLFHERRQQGRLDLEAVEMAIRSALHQAGAAALSELLHYDPPQPEQRTRPCPCGHTAVYRGLHAKTILTAVGTVELLRPYFLCAHSHQGQFPADVELDVENTELSPGVRRMLALVGHDAPFDHSANR
jgi:hypothetical protein